MEAKIPFGPDEFAKFSEKMKSEDFLEVPSAIRHYEIISRGLLPPERHILAMAKEEIKAPQTIFSCYKNGHYVFVLTTFMKAVGRPRRMAAGWVFIKRRDRVPYFVHPLYRTPNFLEKIFKCAKVNKERIALPHICPHCRRRMEIVKGSGEGSRFWRCVAKNCDLAQNPKKFSDLRPWESFDKGLSVESLEFVKIERGWREEYRKIIWFYEMFLAEEGLTYTPAREKRERWKETK